MNGEFQCIKAGGPSGDEFFKKCPGALHRKDSASAIKAYKKGAIGGTAWLFAERKWLVL